MENAITFMTSVFMVSMADWPLIALLLSRFWQNSQPPLKDDDDSVPTPITFFIFRVRSNAGAGAGAGAVAPECEKCTVVLSKAWGIQRHMKGAPLA